MFSIIREYPRARAMIVIGILIGASIGLGGFYVIYSIRVNQFQKELKDFESQYEILLRDQESLSENYQTLSGAYQTLSGNFQTLTNSFDVLWTYFDTLYGEYQVLSIAYENLQSNYSTLSKERREFSDHLKTLSTDSQNLDDILNSYCFIPGAFQRVFNYEEVEKVSNKVSQVTGNSMDRWYSYERIYSYIISNIDPVFDVEFPYINERNYKDVDGEQVISSFSTDKIENYVQTPGYTLQYQVGNSDDLAVLEYAMIKYYMREILRTEFVVYFANIELSESPEHHAVFIPVHGGELCILDPAGRHITSSGGYISQKAASPALYDYSNHLSTEGTITNIVLYYVDITNGSYFEVKSGSLFEIIEFIRSL